MGDFLYLRALDTMSDEPQLLVLPSEAGVDLLARAERSLASRPQARRRRRVWTLGRVIWGVARAMAGIGAGYLLVRRVVGSAP